MNKNQAGVYSDDYIERMGLIYEKHDLKKRLCVSFGLFLARPQFYLTGQRDWPNMGVTKC